VSKTQNRQAMTRASKLDCNQIVIIISTEWRAAAATTTMMLIWTGVVVECGLVLWQSMPRLPLYSFQL
jgi:hypothetical protein